MKCPYCNGSGDITAETIGFGGMLLLARKAAGMTQDRLAEIVGISRAQIANIESGRSDVPISSLRRYSDALGIPLEGLIP